MNREATLLQSLQERGATICIEDGQLRLRAPKGIFSQEEMDELRARRLKIMELLEDTASIANLHLTPQDRTSPIPLTPMQRMPWYLAATAHPRIPIGLCLSGSL